MFTKLHTKSYSNNDRLFFLLNPNDDIAENDPVRIVDAVVESLDLKEFKKLYRERGRCPYHPKMMLKIILYAYMNNIYSCRKIERVVQRDIHYIWLAAQERPDFVTINRFRNRVKNEINNIFTQVVLLLAERGFITLDVEYIDGTKIESKANKYTFVWRKTVEKNRAKLQEKIRILLQQIDEVIAQDKAAEAEAVEFTPEILTSLIGELKDALAAEPEPTDKEQKKARREQKKQIKELEKHRDKLEEYGDRLEQIGDRNSMSKTDPDATFMHMKEDAMNNGQTKPGYNVQIATENQYIVNYDLYWRPTDYGTLIPFLESFYDSYGFYSSEIVADSGYGSEQNYEFMFANGMTPYVKYNLFHKEMKRKFLKNPFHQANMFYNQDQDFYVCPMGQRMDHVADKKTVSDLGYVSHTSLYKTANCSGCPFRGMCYNGKDDRRTIEVNHRANSFKNSAKTLLTSDRGLMHRSKRPIEPESCFGNIKFNHGFKRFHLKSTRKTKVEWGLVSLAHNLRKYVAHKAKIREKYAQDMMIVFEEPLLKVAV